MTAHAYIIADGGGEGPCSEVCIDVGTSNQELVNDPLYIGQKMPRLAGEQYDDLMDEFVDRRVG